MTIDDGLLAAAKAVAASTGTSLGAVVDDGLRLLLARRALSPTAQPPVLPVFGGSGLRPGVDLEDKDGLAALLDAATDAATDEPVGSRATS